MNIYTLHKEGSFRPPSLDCDDDIPPSQSLREQTTLNVVREEKNPRCATSVTSGTSGTGTGSSLGEKTTPRYNTRAVVSRIDATGVITDTNTTQLMKSKSGMTCEMKERARERVKKVKGSGAHMKKVKRTGLIHIQAKDEFMIFEDNTDLVSHITTPSAVRTSPLESDYLVIDHDEFAEEEDLFSAITVPKALRKKKHKKRKSKKNANAIKASGKENVHEAEECKSKLQEQRDLKTMSSNEETENGEEREEPREPQPPSPPRVLRANSLDRPRDNSVKESNLSVGGSRSPNLRGGKRQQGTSNQAEKPSSPPTIHKDNDHTSQDEKAEKTGSEMKSPQAPYDEEKDAKIEHQSEEMVQDQDASKSTVSGLTPISPDVKQTKSQDVEVTSQPSPAISRPEIFDATPEKLQPSDEQEEQEDKGEQVEQESEYDNNSAKLDNVKISKSPPARKDISEHSTNHVPYETNRDVNDQEAGVTGLDYTATTARLDATNIEAATEVSEVLAESPTKMRKSPKSRKPKKSSTKFWLPTDCFCSQRKKKREQMEKEQSSEPMTMKSAMSDSNAFENTKEGRNSR